MRQNAISEGVIAEVHCMHISSISALILDILAIYSPIWLCLRQDAAVGLRSYTYYADGPIIAN